jgi:hypothetical protein
MRTYDSDNGQSRAFLDETNLNKEGLGQVFNIDHRSVPENVLSPKQSAHKTAFDYTRSFCISTVRFPHYPGCRKLLVPNRAAVDWNPAAVLIRPPFG